MNILLATGIYPPDIGGPATYAKHLAEELQKFGHTLTVLTYGGVTSHKLRVTSHKSQVKSDPVIRVSKEGSMFLRWMRYAKALREHGADADVVIALSSVSVGVPLLFARLKKPKKILRLGGDFFWERYTDSGGVMGLRAWYEKSWGFWWMINTLLMVFLLRSFDVLVYSTEFQKAIHERAFSGLPSMAVIENALPALTPSPQGSGEGRLAHTPFRLLSMSRFVGFKNLESLVRAMQILKDKNIQLTMIGSGPREGALRALARDLALEHIVTFRSPVENDEKSAVFREHDLLVIPSTTDISPNTALEARASGLPVLLTRETGLSSRLTLGMVTTDLLHPTDIAHAVLDIWQRYAEVAREAAVLHPSHDWSEVASAWHTLLTKLV